MRVFPVSAFILFVIAATLPVSGQQKPPKPIYFVALADPACPVTGFAPPAPVAKEIRVLYFPTGQGATIRDPKSPTLHLVFDNGLGDDNNRAVPFIHRDDGSWQSTVKLNDRFPRYAVYWIEDLATKQVDTNGGKYFEVPFCDLQGHRDEESVRFEAESYTGQLQAHGIERAADYSKAIDVLEEYIHPPSRGQGLIANLWKYKLKLHGDTPEARGALLVEIKQFISDHSADGFGLIEAINFAAYQDWFPPDALESLLKATENKYPDYNPRAFLLSARISTEKNHAKRIALMWELVDKYPSSREAGFARKNLLLTVKDLGQRKELYRQIRVEDPDDPFVPLNMASIYVQANRELPEALSLLDEADKLFAANSQNTQAKIHYFESTLKDVKLRIAIMRADILVRLGRPGEAIPILKPLQGEFTSGSAYYLFGKALENTGDKRAAIEAYLEAVVRPSSDDKAANGALESLWFSEKLGSEQDLEHRIEAKLSQTFNSANYVPHLMGHAAPDFDLTTLHGERLTNSQLRGKKVVMDFWASWCGPCQLELKALQDFQENHPELVVATVVDESAEAKQLESVVRTRNLTTLRISKGSSDLWEKFGVSGVPNTFVIDETGFVRIQHVGALPDVARYLQADLKAISDAGPAKGAVVSAK